MADRRRDEPFIVIAGRLPEPTLNDHSLPIAHTTMAWGAVDLKPIMSSIKILTRYLNRNGCHVFAIHLARIPRFVQVQLAARHGIGNCRTRGSAIPKEISRGKRLIFRLVVHVLPASASGQHGTQSNCAENCPMPEQRSPHCLPIREETP